MSEPRKQSAYEMIVATILVLLFAGCGWGPFILKALSLPFVEQPMLFASIVLSAFALGLLYEAAERLLSDGRGIYAAAIFCSLPATGMLAAEPGSLAVTGAMVSTALALWLVSRARGDDRPYFLAMLGVLLLFAGYFYGFYAGTLSLIFAAWLAGRQGDKARIVVPILLAAFAVGIVGHSLIRIGLPTLGMVEAPTNLSISFVTLPWLPWTLWIFPAAIFFLGRNNAVSSWWGDAVGTLLLVAIATYGSRSGISASVAVAAPTISLLTADVLSQHFSQSLGRESRFAISLPALLAAIVLLVLPLLSAIGVAVVPMMEILPTGAAIFLAVGIVWTIYHDLPRWTFPFLFGAGMLFGRILDTRDSILHETPIETHHASLASFIILLGTAILLAVILHFFVERRLRPAINRDSDFQFGGADFRRFNRIQSPNYKNKSSPVDLREPYTFAVFGDVTGAESPFSTRRGGYFVFRSFARILTELRPAFAISLGDLATQATTAAYSRLRKLLAQLPVPIMVTPGNHDMVSRDEYNAAFFHECFGRDNAAFRLGSVQFVLLNNAWGSINPAQFEWLEQTLANEHAPFTLVFCHKPPFELRDGEFYAMEERTHAAQLHEIFKQHHVTAVFSGHVHSLLTDTRDDITYIVSGGGGSKLVGAKAQHHFLRIDVSASELLIRALPLSPAKSSAPLLELRLHPRP